MFFFFVFVCFWFCCFVCIWIELVVDLCNDIYFYFYVVWVVCIFCVLFVVLNEWIFLCECV